MQRRKHNENRPRPSAETGIPKDINPREGRRGKRDTGRGGGSAGQWLYGTHAALAALNNPNRNCRRLLITTEARAALADRLPEQPQGETAERLRLDQMLPPGAVHQGIAVLADPLEELDLQSACVPVEGQRNIVVLLDQVTDPHNVGAILRSAAAFGARAVITTDRHAPEASGALAKAASGAVELVSLVRITNLARALDEVAELGYWRIGLDGDGDRTLPDAAKGTNNIAIVLGAEGKGLRRLTAEKCDFLARLPIRPEIESLNVSNAAAVALYELAREQ